MYIHSSEALHHIWLFKPYKDFFKNYMYGQKDRITYTVIRWCITCPQGVCPKILVSFARRFCIICPKILYHLPEDFVSFARRAKKCVVCPKHTVSFARRNLYHLPARIARHTLKSSSLKIRFYCKGQK